MPSPIGIQLYTVREALAKDFAGVVTRLAEIGYVGVETAGFPGTTPKDAGQLFRKLKLSVPSMHGQMPLGDKKNEVLDTAAALGCEYLVIASLPADDFKTADGIKRNCERLNEANAVARDHKLKLGYHNHWFEFAQVGGKLGHEIMRENLDPAIIFELDTYWIKTAGVDPVQVIKAVGARAPLLHIKDGPAKRDVPQVAVGKGALDIPAIIHAGQPTAQWHIVELDSCATDMMEAVEQSYKYLISKGLVRGNKS